MPRVESPIVPAAGQRRRNRIIEPNRPVVRQNRNAAGFQPPTPLVPIRSSSDESSPGSDDSSATPAVLQTGGCSVVWSNPAYRSELVSNSGSSSSSEGSTGFLINGSGKQDAWRTGETDCSVNFEFSSSEDRKVAGIGGFLEQSSSRSGGGSMQQQAVSFEYSCSDVKVAAAGTAAVTGEPLEQTSGFMREDASDFGSTRKTLFDLPAFREACSEDEERTGTCVFEVVDEGWVHGPDRDIESEVCAAFVEAELEDEADRKLEAELQSGIAALSRKLAGMQQKTVKRSDPVVTRKPAAVSAGQTTKQRKHESVPAAAKQSRQKTSNLNKANATERKQMPKEKPDKLALNRLEEQLKTLRLSPHFWGKNHDWVRSLRGGGASAAAAAAAKAKAGPVKNSRPNRAVLGEKNVQDAGAKYQQQQPQVKRLKENRQKTFTVNASRGLKQASKEVNPSAACVKAGGKVDRNKTRN